jgi:hypothetical protein
MAVEIDNKATVYTNWSRVKRLAENFGVSALASIAISTILLTYFEIRLENSKNHAAIVIHQRQEFDEAQNKIFIELGLYTGRVFDNNDPRKRESLESAIVTAILQTNSLSNEVGPGGRPILAEYANELENLRKQVQSVYGPKDLGPVLGSAQTVLKLHDEVAEKINENMKVSIF